MSQDSLWKPPAITWETASEKYRRELGYAWFNGALWYKLDPDQRRVYEQIKTFFATCHNSAERWFALDAGRRWGKDQVMCTLSLEAMMLAKPRARISYGAPTANDCADIIEPIILDMLEDCPPELRPLYLRSKHRFEWPDGRKIVCVGCDLHPERLRGKGSIAIFLTEPGFMANLDVPVGGVMAAIEAQLMDAPDAFRVYGSTPPETPAHPWTTKYIATAKARGNYVHRTSYDSPRYSREQVDGFVREAGGPTSSKARREYMAEHVTEESLMLIPEWPAVRDECICEIERPPYADCYVSLDPGWTAFSVELFAYWHFDRQELIIERDYGEVRANTARIAELNNAAEKELWEKWPRYVEGHGHSPQPYRRVSDIDQRLIADLWSAHQIRFIATSKRDTLDTEIAHLRLQVQNKKVRIHPRCTTLISHLDHGIWNKQRTQFSESGECGHFDAVAALMYLVRNIDRAKNPYPPATWKADKTDAIVLPWSESIRRSPAGQALEQAFGGRRAFQKRRW